MSSRAPAVGLEGRFTALEGRHSLPGIAALVRLIIDQMRRDSQAGLDTAAFVSGYPGSPLAGLDRELHARQRLLDEHRIVHQPGLNEELAATAVFGSQAASAAADFTRRGVLGVWYGKAPGLDRASDAIRHATFAGTGPASGALVLVGDDPACKSSTLPSASEGLCADLRLPLFQPADSQDILDLGNHAIALSRYSGLWTAMKIVTPVADGASTVDLAIERVRPQIPSGGQSHRVVTRLYQPFTGEQEQHIEEVRLPLAREYAALNSVNRTTVDSPSAWLGIVAAGHTYLETMEAFRLLGLGPDDLRTMGVRILRLGMTYPLVPAEIRHFADGLDSIFVAEEKRPFIETGLRSLLYGMPSAPIIEGKQDRSGTPLVHSWGVLDAARLAPLLRSMLERRVDPSRLRTAEPAIEHAQRTQLTVLSGGRPPWFCSGCPHATSTRVPEGSLVGTGIGCHAIAARMPPERTGTVLSNTQMGGEGAQWIGAAPFLRSDHLFQNMGDGTLSHSGWLAIRFAVEAKSHITFKLLFNDAVAMTGGQPIPGGRPVAAVVRGLQAEGVGRIIVTTEDLRRYRRVRLGPGVDVWDRSRILEAQTLLKATPGVTVLLHDQECAAEVRRKRSRGLVPTPAQKVVINHRVCEACGDCGVKSACLSLHSVETPFGTKTDIHQSSCNLDKSCVDGDCPSFMLVEPARKRRRKDPSKVTTRHPDLRLTDDANLADPKLPVVTDQGYVIRMPGIGGTGVVTVAQILAMAATLDGLDAHGIDQTGLSQKAGAVVSDLVISRTSDPRPGRISPLDLYLVFDQLVALGGDMDAVDPQRTLVVGSTSWSPTGPMIGRPFAPGLDEPSAEKDLAVRAKQSTWIDASALAESLFGKSTAANILLVGVAYQVGSLPISASAIEQAIRQNGVAADTNVAAFRAGRRHVLTPAGEPARSLLPTRNTPLRTELEEFTGDLLGTVALRADDLVSYQSVGYARGYLSVVRRAAATRDVEFADAVARSLYKLMAYKDEYEVARLHLEPEAVAQAEAVAGVGARRVLLLHPPMLRAVGLNRKVKFGPSFTPVLRALAWARWLRGTPFDPFGLARVRRAERRLIEDYIQQIDQLITDFELVTRSRRLEIARLPEMIRGYEDIKLDNIAKYRARLIELSEHADLAVEAAQ